MDQLSGAGDHREFPAAFPDDDHRSTTTNIGGGDRAAADASFMFHPPASASSSGVLPWPPPPLLPAIMENLNAIPAASGHFSSSMLLRDQERFFPPPLPPLPPPPPPPAFYHDLYARRAAGLQFAYDSSGAGLGSSSSDPLGLAAGLYLGGGSGAGRAAMAAAMYSSPFELGKMTPQEIMDAKALAASKSHSEAERRRRERINAHLARLRSLLPSTTKTDKASLLAEVIQHVKELKRQTSEIAEESPLPTETDELTVDAACDADGRFLVRASLCCDDRSDLLPDLIRALKALRLRTLKAEITTLGGRIKNVLVITAEDAAADDQYQQLAPEQAVASIQDALKAVMERPAAGAGADESATSAAAGGGGIKRQRTATLSGGAVLEHRSI